MHTILMPVTANIDRAMGQAETIASLPLIREEVNVVIINVLDEDASIPESSDMLKPERLDSIRQTKSFLEDQGISVETKRVAGDPVRTIVELANEINADSIFVGGTKRSPAGKAVFGSTSQKIILNAQQPVTVTIQSN